MNAYKWIQAPMCQLDQNIGRNFWMHLALRECLKIKVAFNFIWLICIKMFRINACSDIGLKKVDQCICIRCWMLYIAGNVRITSSLYTIRSIRRIYWICNESHFFYRANICFQHTLIECDKLHLRSIFSGFVLYFSKCSRSVSILLQNF